MPIISMSAIRRIMSAISGSEKVRWVIVHAKETGFL